MIDNNLNIIFWNCRSIKNNYLELYDLLSINNVDICFLTETWLTSNVNIPKFGYNCIRCDRSDRRGGGVAILVKQNIKNYKPIFVKTNIIENVGITLKTADSKIINLFAVYFPGGIANPESKGTFRKDVRKLLKIDSNVIICGDLNSRHRNWNCLRANVWGNILTETLSILPYTVLFPDLPTYVPTSHNHRPSTIDIIISNIPQHITQPKTLNLLSSDHLPVSYKIKFDASIEDNFIFDYKHANWGLYKNTIDNAISHLPSDFKKITNTNVIDSNIEIFTQAIFNAVDIAVPKKSLNLTKYRIPSNIKDLITIRNFYRRQWLRYRNSSDFILMNNYSAIIRKEMSIFRNKTWDHKIQSLDKASKPFWNISKCLRKKRTFIPPLVEDSNTYYSDAEKVNQLSLNFLKNHYVSKDLGEPTHIAMVNEVCYRFSALDITTDADEYVKSSEIKIIIQESNPRKSSGLDGIKNKMLKQLPGSAIEYLCFIVNSCLVLQYFPKNWKTAKIVPVAKPNKPMNSMGSYRPISLLSSLSKILEKILKIRLLKFLEQNRIIPLNQFGFKRFHSTVHQIKRIHNYIKSSFDAKKSAIVVSMDIEKAFDTVWHNGLIYKLVQSNCPLYLIKIIKSFLNNRLFSVCLNNEFSDLVEIPAGVPQGSVLGPILYNIYCHDMPDFKDCECATYADDTCLFSSHEYGDTLVNNLQSGINNLVNYFNKWKIKINEEKTQAVFFSRKRKSCFFPKTQIKINNIPIPWSGHIKYLGVYMDKKLIYELHIKKQIEKFCLAKGMLYPLIKRKSPLSNENKIILAKVIFQSILLYACPVWGVCAASHIKKLQICQNKLLKMMLDLPWHFSTKDLHYQNNISLLQDRIKYITERFKLFCGLSENPLIANLYS